MTDDDEGGVPTTQLNIELPTELKDRFDEAVAWGEKATVVERLITQHIGGEVTSERDRLRFRREDLHDDIETLTNEITRLERDREKKHRQLDRVDERLDHLNTVEGDYEQKLTQAEGALYNGVRITAEHRVVNEAADIAGTTAQDVLTELQDRNPGVPATAWTTATAFSEDANWGGCTEAEARAESTDDATR